MNKLNEFVGKLVFEMALSDCYVNGKPAISDDTLMKTIRKFDQESNHGWIPVELNTPHRSGRFLCWCVDETNNKEGYFIGWYCASSENCSSNNWWIDDESAVLYKVVAWQPLPERYERK